MVAPADGIVSLVDDAVPPAESGLGDQPRPRVSTFLSIFDVPVQRSPLTGTVTAADEDSVTLQTDGRERALALDDVRQARMVVIF